MNQTDEVTQPVRLPRRHFFRSVLWLIIIIILLAVGYYYFQLHHQAYMAKQADHQQQLQTLQQQIDTLQQQLQKANAQQTKILKQLQPIQDGQDEIILVDAIFLLQRAQLQLQVDHDPQAAMTLLNLALINLQRSNNYLLNQVQQAVSHDWQILQAIPVVDRQNIIEQIAAMQQQVQRLSVMIEPQTAAVTTMSQTTDTSWRRILDKIWRSLQDIVVIEHTDHLVTPLASQAQVENFKQYLQSLLQQAAWGMLQHNNLLYQAALQQTQVALEQYFPKDNPQVVNIQQIIILLQKITVAPKLPRQLNSLDVANKVQAEMLANARKAA